MVTIEDDEYERLLKAEKERDSWKRTFLNAVLIEKERYEKLKQYENLYEEKHECGE